MSSANNGADNAANVAASRKRKSTTGVYQVGSSSKRAVVELQLFPTHPVKNEFNPISPSPALNNDANVEEDPFEQLFKSQYEKTKETCKQYFDNIQNDLLRQAEERASRIRKEKDMEIGRMKSMISYYEAKLASNRARFEYQNEVIKDQNSEIETIKREYIKQEKQVEHFKSEAEIWKGKAERAEEMLWKVSPRRQAPCCCCENEEDTALSSSVGETS